MKTLLILRHAKSSWKNPHLSDHDRPLNPRGKKAAPRMGRLMKDENIIPDLIICSTAQRARDTMNLCIEASGFNGAVVQEPDLYGSTAYDYIEVINRHAEQQDIVMTIGHNPTCEELLYCLTDQRHRMPTAALAAIKLDLSSWQELQTSETKGELKNLWRPKELD